MSLLARACRLCSPRTFSLLYKRDCPSPSLLRPSTSNLPATSSLPALTAQLHRMSTTHSPPNLQEPSPKRRKLERPSPRFIHPYRTMASESKSKSVQLELTEVESKLRQLLLDVAAYIDESPAVSDEPTAVKVPEELGKEKVVLRWTGGWVRDKLLGVGSHDIDVAINKMTGENFGLKIQEYLELPGNAEKYGLIEKDEKTNNLSGTEKAKRIAPGLHKIAANPEKSKNLETANTKILGIEIDLVNLRKEVYNEISRNPEMEFGTAEEDAVRRDATINAMFYNLHTCQVEDFTGQGFDDMAAHIIRTPLEPFQTFKDDPLRVLRLIRFSSRLDYTIEPETAKAMGDPTIQDVLKIKISRERVGIELEKMLKGPRPRMALELIDRFGLYQTVFTDPTRELPCKPDTEYFQPAYDFVQSVLQKNDGIPAAIHDTLLRDRDEQYLAWICATVVPWADAPTVPHHKPLQRPFFPAYLVAREGFKAPNKVCDVIAASLTNSEEIHKLVFQCAKGLRQPNTMSPSDDPTARDTLGMAVRRWGSTWRTQVLFNMIHEVVLGQVSKEQILSSYAAFITHLAKLNILDADTFKPLLKGTDLAKALNTKPGPWMKDALDVVMAWQLRNPDSTDSAAAIEAVKANRDTKSDSELPFRLASHFLKLTIPPLFPQYKSTLSTLEASRQPAPWKKVENQYALDLLRWSIGALDGKEVEANWQFLVPPILKMMDDMDVAWKAKGCQFLNLLLESLRQPRTKNPSSTQKHTPNQNFLHRTGYHNVFAQTLWPLFSYLPSLTPEPDSATLFNEAFPALTSLALLLPPDTTTTDKQPRTSFLDTLLRTAVLAPLSHFPTPAAHPALTTTILTHLPPLLSLLGINAVKHLPALLPLLTAILKDPFALAHTRLVAATLRALHAVVMNAWPRVPGHRGTLMLGLCVLWARCGEADGDSGEAVEEVKRLLLESVEMLDAVMRALDESDARRVAWAQEKVDIIHASAAQGRLLGVEGCV
ncbi:tRNA nucleotidyltransferas-like protein [Dothidotthia symphoricarpi CBS 119687]|uniref:tRNA nucleotidyltransferas-like protein n=1 Tax=Dothidotthia symphoricarpi CBS 119687 TaxID=1392245 RepID=A0A6A6AF47_9PLEO|nr:tRNA nucleotidyltransferas-like protein [Dothidotthia symphoricarpi CBS 119687]KAF2129557.1 tRNA nucleotidyltransferas-like protein [Dothidotthia symphoricarpi CBS 119687]